MSEQAGEKTEEATPRKKQESRRKGMVAKSRDLVGAFSLLAIGAVAPFCASALAQAFGTTLAGSQPPPVLTPVSAVMSLTSLMLPVALAGLPLLLVALVASVSAGFAQAGFAPTLEPLTPKLERLDPFKGFKKLFGIRSFVEGLKATAKFALFGYLAYSLVSAEMAQVLALSSMATQQAVLATGEIIRSLLMKIALTWLVLAALDYFFERKQLDKELRMTRDELKREMKEQEGSPELKGAIIRRRRALSRKAGLAKRMEQASVVITNPTHFAVALEYRRNEMYAPLVVAKGADYLAARIREMAKENKVPVIENPPLARQLYKECEVGDYVPRDLFGAVAEVMAYVYRLTGKRN